MLAQVRDRDRGRTSMIRACQRQAALRLHDDRSGTGGIPTGGLGAMVCPAYFFGFSFRLMVASLRVSKELSVRAPLDAPLYSALSS